MKRSLLVGGIAALLALVSLTPARMAVAAHAVAFVTWMRGAGLAGVALFAAAYVVAALLLIPGALLTLGAGFAYGPWLGLLVVSPVSLLAATVAFTLGRGVAREWVTRRIGSPRFTAVDEAIGREGFKIVVLLRLSPLFPYAVLNYALGLTRVRAGDFVLASWLGMLPGTLLYIYLGSLLTSATALATGADTSHQPVGRWVYWTGLAATVLGVVVITRTARRALQRALDDPASAHRFAPPR